MSHHQQWWQQQQGADGATAQWGNRGNRAWKKWNRWNQQAQQAHQQNGQWGSQQQQQFGGHHPWQQWCNGRQPENGPVISSNLSNCKSENEKNKQPKVKLMADFVTDVTLPDRSYYPTDTVLTKTWKMRNNGENEWGNDVELVFFKGNESLTLEKRYPVNNAQIGQEVEVSAVIKTPKKAGRYCSYYRLQRNGEYFGPRVWVDIFAVDECDAEQKNKQPKWKKNQQKREQNKMQKLEKKEEKIKAKQAKIEAKIGGVCNKLNAQNDGAKSDKLMQKKQKLIAKQEKLQQKVEKIVSKKDKKAPVVIDEQQLLDDIANAAVKDLGLNEDQKQQPVLSSLSCVCGR